MTWLITRLICHNARKITGSLELTEMPVIKSDSLLKLELAENKIHTIKEGSFLPKLDSLNLDDNHLTNGGISFGAFDGIGSLRTLTLNKNDLSAFPAGLPSSLNTLHLEENKITEFPIESVQHLSQLRELQIQRNKVNDQVCPKSESNRLKSSSYNNRIRSIIPNS